MCGIFGIFISDENEQAYQYILNGITVLQHRGQDAAGIYTSHNHNNHNNHNIYKHKNIGKVEEVFKTDLSAQLLGNYGIGHLRYSTTGNLSIEQSQPLNLHNISLVHNGNLTNTNIIISVLKSYNIIGLDCSSDSNILLHYFNLVLQEFIEKDTLPNAIFNTVKILMQTIDGSYSVIMMIPEFGLITFRDPNGIRPLCFGGKNFNNTSDCYDDYVFSSESVAIQSSSFHFIRDVKAGECIITTKNNFVSKQIINHINMTPCLFEYIYFARPESVIDGILVYQARKNMGEALANKIIAHYPDILKKIDVVMPVPDSARISALRASYVLQKPYCEGLIKNNYIGRTFIMPNQEQRKKNIKMKLSTIDQEFANKNVLLIDDSIVRGNTSIQLINLVRKAGAKQIVFASIAPPVVHPNIYGIAIPTSEELIAYKKTHKEICDVLGADELIYNDLEDVINVCRQINPNIDDFETSCFSPSINTNQNKSNQFQDFTNF
jgi:amidophosphoribosyltransferase